ncbi:MAG: YdcH family protein [Caulobacterales bacterium]
MAIDARIRELGVRHQTLERAIQDEMSRPAYDETRLRELKRQKLRLKEELEGLRTQAH